MMLGSSDCRKLDFCGSGFTSLGPDKGHTFGAPALKVEHFIDECGYGCHERWDEGR